MSAIIPAPADLVTMAEELVLMRSGSCKGAGGLAALCLAVNAPALDAGHCHS